MRAPAASTKKKKPRSSNAPSISWEVASATETPPVGLGRGEIVGDRVLTVGRSGETGVGGIEIGWAGVRSGAGGRGQAEDQQERKRAVHATER